MSNGQPLQGQLVDPAEVARRAEEEAKLAKKPLKNDAEVRDFLWSNQKKLEGLLPPHLDVKRFLAMAFRAVVEGPPGLMMCTRASILNSVLRSCKYGLELDGILGEAYLVPFKSECQLIPGYKGLMKLGHQAQEIKTIIAACVYKADKFKYQLGMHVDVRHLPLAETDEEMKDENITHAYAIVELRNGGYIPCVWPRTKILKHRNNYSSSFRWAENGDKAKGGGKKDSIWHTNFVKMSIKTALRDLMGSGAIPLSAELGHDIREMIELEKKYEGLMESLTSGVDPDDEKQGNDLLDRMKGVNATVQPKIEEKPEATPFDVWKTTIQAEQDPARFIEHEADLMSDQAINDDQRGSLLVMLKNRQNGR